MSKVSAGVVIITLLLFIAMPDPLTGDTVMSQDITQYKKAEDKPSSLFSRRWMTYAMGIAKKENFAPASAARWYAYVASIFADVLEKTHDTSQANLATAQVIGTLLPAYRLDAYNFMISTSQTQANLNPAAEKILKSIIAKNQSDHFDLIWDKHIPPGPLWYIRNNIVDKGAMAGQWTPWILSEDTTFNTPPPPTRGSMRDTSEQEQISYAVSHRQLADFNSIFFWHGTSGYTKDKATDNITPAGVWQNILFVEKGENAPEEQYANAQKLLAQSIADSFIFCWRVKYTYFTQRPSMRMSGLELAVADPPFPGYVSGHSTISKTAAVVLSYIFPDKTNIWHANARDARNSRLIAGIHFNTDNAVGEQLGLKIGQEILHTIDPSLNKRPDKASFNTPNSITAFFGIIQIRLATWRDLLRNAAVHAWTYWISPKPESRFVDVARKAGVLLDIRSTPYQNAFTPLTPGASWSDYDNDGFLDLFVPSMDGKSGNTLFRNDRNGSFTEVSKLAGVNYIGHSWSGVFADYDNDGCSDLYVANYGLADTLESEGEANLLYHNNCNGTFTEVTAQSGTGGHEHSAGTAWTDYNHDGYVDLYVANHGVLAMDHGVMRGNYERNRFYRNNKDGTFTEIAEKLGIADIAPPYGTPFVTGVTDTPKRSGLSFQPVFFDYNNDGHSDLFVATDFGISPLYRNNGNGTFTDVTDQSGLTMYGTGMGVAVDDYNNDGYLDLYVTNYDNHFLWHNNGDGTFTETAKPAHVDNPRVGWGVGFLDYDNNATRDLYVINGVEGPKYRYPSMQKENNKDALFRNDGDGMFTEVTAKAGVADNAISMGAAFGDFDNNGFTDIFIMDEGKTRLYQNLGNKNHWLTVQLKGTTSNRDGIGARLTAQIDGKSYIQEVAAGGSYVSQNSPWVTFGTGRALYVDILTIQWPSGTRQTVRHIPTNQKLVVVEKANTSK